jgi:hypothetical protein
MPMKQIALPLHAAYIELYGSLTFGDVPLGKDATLKFPGGGIGFASRESGEYRAALLVRLGVDSIILVAACEGGPKALVPADGPVPRNTRHDINIPDNALTVTVTDTFTRMPVAGAAVRYVINSLPVPRRPIATRVLMTSETGTIEITSVPEREIRLYVTRSGYQDYVVDPFSIRKDEKRNIDVQLVPLRGSSGKIVSNRPFENATIWFSSSGVVSEHADIGEDGTFIFASSHGPNETMAVVSATCALLLWPKEVCFGSESPTWVFGLP